MFTAMQYVLRRSDVMLTIARLHPDHPDSSDPPAGAMPRMLIWLGTGLPTPDSFHAISGNAARASLRMKVSSDES